MGYNTIQSSERRPSHRRAYCNRLQTNRFCLLLASSWIFLRLCSSTLKTEAVCSSKIQVNFQYNAWRCIPETEFFILTGMRNPKSYIWYSVNFLLVLILMFSKILAGGGGGDGEACPPPNCPEIKCKDNIC
jgi:hypothetical protein